MLEITKIPRVPDDALFYLIDILSHSYNDAFDDQGDMNADAYQELNLLCSSIMASAEVSSFKDAIVISESAKNMGALIVKGKLYFEEARTYVSFFEGEAMRERLQRRFALAMTDPLFALEKDEKDRVLVLSGEMRDLVAASDVFDENHKKRLLDRISSVEAEVYKPEGKLDVILGGVTDFGDALGRFGKSIKPITDRMREIRGIAQKTSKEYDGLPAPDEQKRLPAPEE